MKVIIETSNGASEEMDFSEITLNDLRVLLKYSNESITIKKI